MDLLPILPIITTHHAQTTCVYGETFRLYHQLNQFRLGYMMMQLSTHHSTWRRVCTSNSIMDLAKSNLDEV
jgi:hypothetical protein